MTITTELTIGVIFTFVVQFVALLRWIFSLSNKNDNNEKNISDLKESQKNLIAQNTQISNMLNEVAKTLAICQAVNKSNCK